MADEAPKAPPPSSEKPTPSPPAPPRPPRQFVGDAQTEPPVVKDQPGDPVNES